MNRDLCYGLCNDETNCLLRCETDLKNCSTLCSSGSPLGRTKTPSTTASTTDILILSTYNPSNVPLITNSSGHVDSNLSFKVEAEVNFSCGLTYRGEHFVFGGSTKTTQIAKIDGCQLKTIGQLSFQYCKGACANVAEENIYLCFNADDSFDFQKCRKASNPLSKFVEVTPSNAGHQNIRIAASQSKLIINQLKILQIPAEILALGSYVPDNKIAEIFNINQDEWSTIQSYPFDKE